MRISLSAGGLQKVISWGYRTSEQKSQLLWIHQGWMWWVFCCCLWWEFVVIFVVFLFVLFFQFKRKHLHVCLESGHWLFFSVGSGDFAAAVPFQESSFTFLVSMTVGLSFLSTCFCWIFLYGLFLSALLYYHAVPFLPFTRTDNDTFL